MEGFAELLGESLPIEAIRHSVGQLLARAKAGRRLPAVLIGGETGTGKGLVARLIHRHGPRANGPFVDINCAAIPEALLEAELFGFERGAFTDARRAKPGLFQTAHRGTIFLDEVGLLPEPLQAKLLKVLEERSVRRLGSTASEPVDVWVISATNADLKEVMAARRFREDLYHRLAVVTIELPPLRERGRDIALLANHFLARACTDYGLAPKRLTPGAEARLMLYRWPGNIRELANVMERVALLVDDEAVEGGMLELEDTPEQISAKAAPESAAISDTIREHLLAALEQTKWNISRTAIQLRLSRNTVRARIRKFGLKPGASPVTTPRAPARASAPASAPAAPLAAPRLVTPARAAASVTVRWEHRRVTFLRVVLLTAADPEAPLETHRALDTLLEKAKSFGGRIEEIGPRSIGAVFGVEPAEDAPRRAALAAMAIQKAAERGQQEDGKGFAVKVGIHVGEVLVGQSSIGPQVDADARRDHWHALDVMLEPARAGATLVSHAARPFLERRFDLAREAEAPTVAYLLHGPERKGLSPRGRMARFVGRGAELELLKSRLAAPRTGGAQIVAIVGGAGIGKSRLLHEFRQTLRGEAITYLEGRCVSYGSNIPYLPVIEALCRGCRVTDDDTPGQVLQKFRVALERFGIPPDDSVPYLMRFMGLQEGTGPLEGFTPEVIRARTSQILRQMCLSASRHRPLVVVIEDLHWIDPASETLGRLGETLGGVPLLLILTYRPDYAPSWLDRSRVTQISLQPLSTGESRRVLQDILPPDRLAEPIAQEIIERADGNPFFLEELGRTVREDGGIPLRGDVPQTVQEVLFARINRLPEPERRVLQVAAAIGRDVPIKVLTAASGLPGPSLAASLQQLQAGEFLHETGVSTDVQYSFRHALTHEVAYGSLRPEERRTLHSRIAEIIEQLYPERLTDFAGRLADHALLGEVWDKAVDYLREAGARAFSRGAVEEALARYEQALTASDRLPRTSANRRRAIDVRVDLHGPLLVLGQVPRLVELHRQAEPLVRELGDPHRLCRLYQRISQYSWMEAKYDAGIDYARRSIELATSTADTDGLVLATYSLAQSQYSIGEYQTATDLFVRVVDGPNAERAKRLLAASISTYIAVCGWLAQALSHLGDLNRAIGYSDLGVRAADESEQPQAQAIAYTLAAIPRVYSGGLEEAVSLTERALNLCETKGLLTWFPGASSTLGWALAAAGRVEEGLRYLERGPSILASLGVSTHLALMYARWAEGLLLAGRLGEARDIAERAIETAVACGERGHEAEGCYVLGCVLAAGDPPDLEAATARFVQARERAGELGMRSLLARCHLGLGQLDRGRGDETKAGAQLALAERLFRETGMRLWLKRTQAVLRRVG